MKTFTFFLKLAVAMVCCLPQVLKAQSDTDYVPNALIVQYEPLTKTTLPVGEAILKEHAGFAYALKQKNVGFFIKKVEPLIPQLIERMVKENRTETQVHQAIYEQRMVKKGSKNAEPKSFDEYNFARAMYLELTSPIAGEIVKHPENFKKQMEAAGYRLISIGLDHWLTADSEPNDELYPRLWQHRLTGMPLAWKRTTGDDGVMIAVLDSGVDLWHEDLWDNLLPGYDFVQVDTSLLASWHLVDGEDYVAPDDEPFDRHGHGTHVAGIAAAAGNNGWGVVGVCPGCKMMPIRTHAVFRLEEEQDTVYQVRGRQQVILQGLMYAIENGADIINLSFGSYDSSDEAEKQAYRYAYEQGVVLVASAGNDDYDVPHYPAALPEVIAVAATYEDDVKTDFSNYGNWINISAPGFDIISTAPYDGLYDAYVSHVVVTDEFELPLTQFPGSRDISEWGEEVTLNYVGKARQQDLLNPNYNWNLTGKIAVVDRGEIPLSEKTRRVREYGAIGIIFVNTQDVPMMFQTTPEFKQMYVLSMAQSQGAQLIEEIKAAQSLSAEFYADTYYGYSAQDGTSQAAPYVAGAAGLLLSEYPWLTPDEVRERLLAAVDNIDGLNPDYAGKLGTGRINLAKLFDKPTSVEPEPNNGNNTLTMKVFPNPAKNFLMVSLNADRQQPQVQATVYNLMGQVLQHQKINNVGDFTKINIADLPTGVYVIEVLQDGFKIVQKFVRE